MLFNILGILWTFDKFPEQKKHKGISENGNVCLTFLHSPSESSIIFVNAQFILSISLSYWIIYYLSFKFEFEEYFNILNIGDAIRLCRFRTTNHYL